MPTHTYNHSPGNIEGLLAELRQHGIEYTLDTHERDAKANTTHSPAAPHETPLAVLFPTSTQQTSIILKSCNDRLIAVTSFSGGTSFGGALTASRNGMCVSFERMKEIIAVHEDDMDVVVQPGIGWMELNEKLESKGLFFPVDPAPRAKIGGMVSSSSSSSSFTFHASSLFVFFLDFGK